MTAPRSWREYALPILSFPGLLLLAFLVERCVLAPRVAKRPPADAVAFWEGQAASHPDFVPTHVRLGIEYTRARRFDDAARTFEHALALDPHEEQAAMGLNGVLRQRDGQRASIAQMETFLRDNPGCDACRLNLAGDLFAVGELETARGHVDELLTAGRRLKLGAEYGALDIRGETLSLAAQIYEGLGDREHAAALLREAMARNPGNEKAKGALERLEHGALQGPGPDGIMRRN